MMRTLALLCAAGALATAFPAAAINKCVDASGKTTYQEGACAEGAKAGTVKIDAAPARAPSASDKPLSPEEDKEDPRMLDTVSTQGLYDNCMQASPGFSDRHSATYDAWRRSRAELFARLARSPRYQQVLERARSQGRDQFLRVPGGMQKLAQFCEAQFIPALKNNTPH